MKHLWEIDHPYYCEESNYYKGNPQGWGAPQYYNSFSEYLDEWSDADLDMNFIFRWDWKDSRTSESFEEGEAPYSILKLHLMMQRKGCKKYIEIKMKDSDEPSVIKHLKLYWENMKATWEGVSEL